MTSEKFNLLSPEKQRIAVAKDVIAQIKAKRYKPAHKGYVKFLDGNFDIIDAAKDTSEDLQTCIPKLKECAVCARGAIFLSTVKIDNSFSVDNVNYTWNGVYEVEEEDIEERLKLIFGDQQYLIEYAFEGWDSSGQFANQFQDSSGHFLSNTLEMLYDDLESTAVAFHKKYKSPSDRVIAIMENIIKNDGLFKPGKYTLDVKKQTRAKR